MNCKLIDSRNGKEYAGILRTSICVGQPIIVLLADGKHEFKITSIRRCLYVGNRYYIHDQQGIKFTIILNISL